VNGLPENGSTLYARLFSETGGVYQSHDYTFTLATAVPATITSPTSGSMLGTSNVVFTWTSGYGITNYGLWLGTSGPGSSSLYASPLSSATTVTVPSLPARGAKVYARLFSERRGGIQYMDYTYTEAGTPAAMISPVQGSALGASNVKFTWTAGFGVTQYNLWLGLSGPGSSNLYASGWSSATAVTVTTLPAKGATVYARLYSDVNGVTQYNDYTYTEQ
jgi:hypothetical protein